MKFFFLLCCTLTATANAQLDLHNAAFLGSLRRRSSPLQFVQPSYFAVTLTNNPANFPTKEFTETLIVHSNVLYLAGIHIIGNSDPSRNCVAFTNENGCIATPLCRSRPSGGQDFYAFSFMTNATVATGRWVAAFTNAGGGEPTSSSIAMIGITNPGAGTLSFSHGNTNSATSTGPFANFPSGLTGVGSNLVVFLSGRSAVWYSATSNANSGLVTIYDTGADPGGQQGANYIAVCTNSPVSATNYSVTVSNSATWVAIGVEVKPL